MHTVVFSTTGEEEADKRLSPHLGIEPGSPSYRLSMLTTTPMGPVILSSLHWVFDSKCRTSPPRSADGDRYRRTILPAAPCYELIPFTGNYRLLRLRNGTVARGGGDRSRKQIKGLSPHPGIEPASPSYRLCTKRETKIPVQGSKITGPRWCSG